MDKKKTENCTKDLYEYLNVDQLSGATLDGMDLSGLDLRGECFTGTSVVSVIWEDANLRGADLREAIGLDPKALILAEIDHTTKLPEGMMEKMMPLAIYTLMKHAPENIYNDLGDMFKKAVASNENSENNKKSNIFPFWPKPK